jgi:DNA polymerase gamma 1
MLSKPLYEQLFKHGRGQGPSSPALLERSIQHLEAQGLWGKECSTMADLDIRLPQMQGADLDQHFRTIAKAQSEVYLNLATQLVQTKLHPLPSRWSSETGWTRYDPVTGYGERVEYPSDDALVLDVETCVTEGQRPILAVAVSPNAWYSWTSPRMASSQDFIDHMERDTTLEDLIPMEPGNRGVNDSWERPKLVVGHHVSYDRARLKEQYFMKVCVWARSKCHSE